MEYWVELEKSHGDDGDHKRKFSSFSIPNREEIWMNFKKLLPRGC